MIFHRSRRFVLAIGLLAAAMVCYVQHARGFTARKIEPTQTEPAQSGPSDTGQSLGGAGVGIGRQSAPDKGGGGASGGGVSGGGASGGGASGGGDEKKGPGDCEFIKSCTSPQVWLNETCSCGCANTRTCTPPQVWSKGICSCVTPPEETVVMSGAGDIGACAAPTYDQKPDGNQMQTSNLLMAMPGGVFTMGDNQQNSGTEKQFTNCYGPSWGRVKARTKPSPGNHDYGTNNAAAYYKYFGSNAGPSGLGYYSYMAGAWHVVSLNSNITDEKAITAQRDWLNQDLADNPAVCTLAYWHHPLFTSGPLIYAKDGFNKVTKDGFNKGVKDIWDILYKFNVDVVVNGHMHMYERFRPQNSSGNADTKRGIREFVVGTGGVGLWGEKSLGKIPPTSEVRNFGTYGILKLTLRNRDYDWEFVPAVGGTFMWNGKAVTQGKFTDKGTKVGCH